MVRSVLAPTLALPRVPPSPVATGEGWGGGLRPHFFGGIQEIYGHSINLGVAGAELGRGELCHLFRLDPFEA